MDKLISVIIPCFNVSPYIERCIQSLVTQTIGLNKLELIFVNDASNDNTLDILLQYEKLYPESIVIIDLEMNIRQGGARNIGMQYASCTYIGFVDSDDWIEPEMYEDLYRYTYCLDYDIIACDYKRDLGVDDLVMGPTGEQNKSIIIETEEQRKLLYLSQFKGGIYTKIYRKEFLLENKIVFPENLVYEDNYFGALCKLCVNKLYIVEKYYYHYFVNPNSTIMAKNSKHHLDRIEIELMKLSEYKTRGYFNQYYREIEIEFLILFYINTLHILFTRFDVPDYSVFLYLEKSVLNLFPSYQQNPYIEEYQRSWLSLIGSGISEERFKRLAEMFRNSE